MSYYLPIFLLASGLITLFIVLFFASYKLAYKWTVELWDISFNNKNIIIKSNKHAQQIFDITELDKVIFYNLKSALSKSLSLNLQFSKKQNSNGTNSFYFVVGQTFISNNHLKNNFTTFAMFIEEFHEQILQNQLKLVNLRTLEDTPIKSRGLAQRQDKLVWVKK